MWVWGWVYWEHSDSNGLQKTESVTGKPQAEKGLPGRGGTWQLGDRRGGRLATRMGHQSPVLVSPAQL